MTKYESDAEKQARKTEAADANRDPITNAPGAHPVGTGLGAAVGGLAGGIGAAAAAGAAAGTVLGGPIGTAAGLVVGAVVGGLAGKAVAEKMDPTVEDRYWKDNFARQPFYKDGREYKAYAPAFRTGYLGYAKYSGKTFDEVEDELEADYLRERQGSAIDWADARPATRAAWDRVSGAKTLP